MTPETAITKKLGPLPVWAWALIVGGTIGAVMLYRRGSSGGAGSDVAGSGPIIDPTTGAPYSGDFGGGGGGASFSDAPSLLAEVGDISALLGALRDAGMWPTAITDPVSSAIPDTPQYFAPAEDGSAPESAALAQASPSVTSATGKTPLDRAIAAVASGKVGPVNTQRLKAAGYTQAQINYHVAHKSPLQQPAKAAAPAKGLPSKTAKSITPTATAPSHPLQQKTAAAPHHDASPPPAARAPAGEKPTVTRGKDSHGNKGAWHTYSNGRKVFVKD